MWSILARTRLVALLTCLVGTAFSSAQPTVTKVEPPDWLVGHTINPVRLLIRGTNLNGGVLSSSDGLSISRVHTNEAGTYLFADVNIPAQQKPGAYRLLLKGAGGTASVPFRVDAALPASDRLSGFSGSDVILSSYAGSVCKRRSFKR